eukprot:2577261-Amphidinium_carterae.2
MAFLWESLISKVSCVAKLGAKKMAPSERVSCQTCPSKLYGMLITEHVVGLKGCADAKFSNMEPS